MNSRTERPVRIDAAAGQRLEGLVWLAQGGAIGSSVIVCHPHPAYGGSMYNNVVEAVVSECIAHGISTLRFNYRTTGSEEATAGCRGETDDLLAAISYFSDQLCADEGMISLVGYSFGSVVALNAAEQSADIDKVISIAPPVSHMEMEELGNFNKPKYFIHGARDSYGMPSDFGAWFDKLPHPKEALALDVDHFYRGAEALVASHVVKKFTG